MIEAIVGIGMLIIAAIIFATGSICDRLKEIRDILKKDTTINHK